MITLNDGAIIAQLGPSDMREPIQFALTYPHHEKIANEKPFNLIDFSALHFDKMDLERFPMLGLAYEVGRRGGSFPLVYNAANEVANAAFRMGKISFLDIERVIADAVSRHTEVPHLNLEIIVDLDQEIRKKVEDSLGKQF